MAMRFFSLEIVLSLLPGLLFIASLVEIALLLHNYLPEPHHRLFNPLLVSIILGLTCNNLFKLPLVFIPGIHFALRNMLQLAIIAMGAQVTFSQAMTVGSKAFFMIILLMIVIFIIVHGLARLLKIPTHLATLISVGTAVCGNSAIAAVAPVIKASDEDIAFAIATNTLLGTVATFVFPLIGAYLGLTDGFFGAWAGMAVNDTAQAVAAGFAFSHQSGEIATMIKMTRNTLLIVVVVITGIVYASCAGRTVIGEKLSLAAHCKKAVPSFVILFLLVAYANSLGLFEFLSKELGRDIPADIKMMVNYLVLSSLTAAGLNTNFKKLRSIGFRALCLGIIASLTAGAGGFSLLYWLGAT